MTRKTERSYPLTQLSLTSLYTYDLSDEYIIGRAFGLFPVMRIHLAAVYYLRLATPTEPPLVFQLFNWMNLLPFRRRTRPIFILQTRAHHRFFMRLDGEAHFKLRQAIARHAEPTRHRAAA